MSSHPSLAVTGHRPWPLPGGPWRWRQTWHDLLFMHWPVSEEALQQHVPRGLEIDTFDGRAWIGVVPFRMTDVALRGLPALPGVSAFPELNVRTYVQAGGRGGVWFLSLDAASRVAVSVARRLFHLPYHHAAMACRHDESGSIRYRSHRRRGADARFVARYGPTGPVTAAEPGSLDHWLTERYALFARSPAGLRRADIHHAPWPLQPAEAEVELNTMLDPFGLSVEGLPLLHFAARIQVAVWPLRPSRP